MARPNSLATSAGERQEGPPAVVRWAIALAIAALALFIAGHLFHAAYVRLAPIPVETLQLGFGFKSYDAALTRADGDIADARARLKLGTGEWIRWESLSKALLSRARLTGDYGDFTATGAALDRGMAVAESNSGPILTDSAWAMLVHKLPRVEHDLAMVRTWRNVDSGELIEANSQDGDLHFYRGDYAKALDLYRAANAVAPDTGAQIRIAQWQAKMGQPAAATATLEAAARALHRPSRPMLAAILLQLGTIALQTGDWDSAEARFVQADTLFPGYWLYQAHRAQMRAVRGDIPAAIHGYLAILKRQPAPEVMDALALLYRIQGQAAPSRAWAARAQAIWTERLKLLPEAAYAHALEHELVLGDPDKAVTLARANLRARPYGDSQLLLASALIDAGRAAEAAPLLEAIRKSGWDQSLQYIALAQAYALTGRTADSARARAAALERNPRAFDPAQPMLWFGNH